MSDVQYHVTLTACVAGNPLKAWFGSSGPDDSENVPDDVWQDFDVPAADLDAAKDFIRSLHPDVTTHVELHATVDEEDRVLYRQDAGHDDLDATGLDTVPWSETPPLPDEAPACPEAPPVFVPPT